MSVSIPSHLAGHVVALTDSEEPGRTFALRSSVGGAAFELRHCGEIYAEYGLMVAGDAAPLLVVVRAVDTGEEFVLFDGGRHGYDAMFCDEFDPDVLDARVADQLFERDGDSVFGVEVTVFDNVDWDDEEDDFRDDDGVVRLITGEAIDSDRLRSDGFDAIGVTVVTADGARHSVVEEELA